MTWRVDPSGAKQGSPVGLSNHATPPPPTTIRHLHFTILSLPTTFLGVLLHVRYRYRLVNLFIFLCLLLSLRLCVCYWVYTIETLVAFCFCQCLQDRWDDLTWFMDTKGCQETFTRVPYYLRVNTLAAGVYLVLDGF